MCQHKEWGLPVGWIIAMSPGELQTMARAWNELLKSFGLQIDLGEAVWCSTAQDSLTANISVSETVITRRTRDEGIKACGSLSMVTSRKNWPSGRYPLGEGPMHYMTARQHCGSEIQVASAHVMRRVIDVLVFWKLDPDTYTMYTSARSAGPNAEKDDDLCTKTP